MGGIVDFIKNPHSKSNLLKSPNNTLDFQSLVVIVNPNNVPSNSFRCGKISAMYKYYFLICIICEGVFSRPDIDKV